jgi:hypothetical protein
MNPSSLALKRLSEGVQQLRASGLTADIGKSKTCPSAFISTTLATHNLGMVVPYEH